MNALAVELAMLAASVSAQPFATDSGYRNVLILNEADANLPAFVAIDRALREEVRGATNGNVHFFVESLDLLRFPGVEIEPTTKNTRATIWDAMAAREAFATLAAKPADLKALVE